MLDWLKEILGETYTEELDKKISAEIGKGFVSRSDYNTLNETKKSIQGQLTDANKQIDDFKKMDIESIKKAADDWKLKAEKAEKDASSKIADMQFNALLEDAVRNVKGRSATAIKPFLDLDALRSSKKQKEDLESALNALKEKEGYLFEEDKKLPHFGAPTPGAHADDMDAIRAAAGLKPKS